MSSLRAEIRQALAELEMVSHAPIHAYGAVVAAASDEDAGGKRPPGNDGERRPRRPSSPLRPGDPVSEKEWNTYEDELAAWAMCYQRRTVAHFQKQLRARGESEALLAEVHETVRAWRVMRIPPGQPPALGDPLWKRYIGQSNEDAGVLATRFGVTRRYINMVRRQYRAIG